MKKATRRKPARIPLNGGGEISLREIERKDLVKDRIRVRIRYPKAGGGTGFHDAMNWRAAEAKADEIKKDIEAGREAITKSPTFARVCREWMAMRQEKDLSPSTLDGDKNSARYLCEEFRNKKITSILSIDAEGWLNKLAKSMPAQAKACQWQIGQVFRFAKRKNYLAVNPLLEDPIKRDQIDQEQNWVPDWDLMDRLIVFGQGRRPMGPSGYPRLNWSNIKTAIALGAGAGLRIGEVVALRWEHVDFTNRKLLIRKAVSSRGPDDLPKKRKIRDVPMTQWVYDALFEHMHVLRSVGVGGFERSDRPGAWRAYRDLRHDGGFDCHPKMQVIRNQQHPGKPSTRGNWANTFKLFLFNAGLLTDDRPEPPRSRTMRNIETEWRFNALRRFYISALYALRHPELEILEAVGHSSSDVTMKHYARALSAPPGIWQDRFSPAEPDTQDRIIDGSDAVVLDGIAQLPAPDGPDADGVPAWVRLAENYLEGGWKIREILSHFGCPRQKLNEAFRRHGLPPPSQICRAALYRRFEQLYNEGKDHPIDIATKCRVSVSTYIVWRRRHEADAPHTSKSLKELRKSDPLPNPNRTDRKQKQLKLI